MLSIINKNLELFIGFVAIFGLISVFLDVIARAKISSSDDQSTYIDGRELLTRLLKNELASFSNFTFDLSGTNISPLVDRSNRIVYFPGAILENRSLKNFILVYRYFRRKNYSGAFLKSIFSFFLKIWGLLIFIFTIFLVSEYFFNFSPLEGFSALYYIDLYLFIAILYIIFDFVLFIFIYFEQLIQINRLSGIIPEEDRKNLLNINSYYEIRDLWRFWWILHVLWDFLDLKSFLRK